MNAIFSANKSHHKSMCSILKRVAAYKTPITNCYPISWKYFCYI